jgi:hypothetical protein
LNDWNERVAKAKLDDLWADYFAKQKKDRRKEQGIFVVVKRREGRESGARSGREQLMYTLSLEKLWLFFDIKLEWETKQHTPSSLDVEHNIYFSHLHFIVVDRWEKLKHIEKTLQPIEFQVFIVVEREYINEKLEHSFLRL